MGRIAKDIYNQRFGRLVAKERVGSRFTKDGKNNGAVWRCICDCGNECYVPYNSLVNGLTKSCGCLRREKAWRLTHDKGQRREDRV